MKKLGAMSCLLFVALMTGCEKEPPTMELLSSWVSPDGVHCCFTTDCVERWHVRQDGKCYAEDGEPLREKK